MKRVRSGNAIFWGVAAVVFLVYYQNTMRVDQFSTDHRKHLVDMKHRVDKDRLRHLLEAADREAEAEARGVRGEDAKER